MFAGRSALNAKDVSAEPTFVVAPADYYNLVQSTRGVNQDFTNNNGGLDSGNVSMIAGIKTVWTNHLPATAKLIGLMYTPDVYGVVKAMDISSETNFLLCSWYGTS
jgi:hypothetical protein